MATAGIVLFVMGLGTSALGVLLRVPPPVPPNPRATEAQLREARRAEREIETTLAPWTIKLGLLAAAGGALLILVGAIW